MLVVSPVPPAKLVLVLPPAELDPELNAPPPKELVVVNPKSATVVVLILTGESVVVDAGGRGATEEEAPILKI